MASRSHAEKFKAKIASRQIEHRSGVDAQMISKLVHFLTCNDPNMQSPVLLHPMGKMLVHKTLTPAQAMQSRTPYGKPRISYAARPALSKTDPDASATSTRSQATSSSKHAKRII